ncbi:Uu.00g025790.m01.CDS01 [Anthostomella pinea]|uniref:Uu.00g025790.m01.CDS01 n=1 Tax=Anthostomella pinea TaxID=933095 RepID=A0AAI8YCG1_9PEZI|nr:Uu.00g025790.m01.CDS01 [Anthostomella pinea]
MDNERECWNATVPSFEGLTLDEAGQHVLAQIGIKLEPLPEIEKGLDEAREEDVEDLMPALNCAIVCLANQLEDLRLNRSKMNSSWLAKFLDYNKNLSTLHYTTRHQEWMHDLCDYWDPSTIDHFSMNQAIRVGRRQLKQLYLGSVALPIDEGLNEHASVETLVVLPFTLLERLSIDLRWLMPPTRDSGDGRDVEDDLSGFPPALLLPSSLQELELTETWSSADLERFRVDVVTEVRCTMWIQMALYTLLTGDPNLWPSLAFRERLPHLRKVTFSARWPRHDKETMYARLEDLDDVNELPPTSDEAIKRIKELFMRLGVEFVWKWQEFNMRAM